MAKCETSGIEVSKMFWGNGYLDFFLKDLCGEKLLDSEVSGIHKVITLNLKKNVLIKRRAPDEFHLKTSLLPRS